MTPAHYFIHQEYLGEAQIPEDGVGLPPPGHAFFCSTCGDIWARIITGPGCTTYCHLTPCEKHTPRFAAEGTRFPGSLLGIFPDAGLAASMDWPRTLTYLPPAVLAWEFQVHLTVLQKQERQESPNG
jgi:hypothetical protein